MATYYLGHGTFRLIQFSIGKTITQIIYKTYLFVLVSISCSRLIVTTILDYILYHLHVYIAYYYILTWFWVTSFLVDFLECFWPFNLPEVYMSAASSHSENTSRGSRAACNVGSKVFAFYKYRK